MGLLSKKREDLCKNTDYLVPARLMYEKFKLIAA